MKRTVLAGRARLNYSALIRYLRLLETLRWTEAKDSGSLITITNIGRSFNKLLEQPNGPSDISEDALERLVEFSREQNVASAKRDTSPSTKAKTSVASNSCMFCGNTIKDHNIIREIDGQKYSFDRRECSVLFMRFREAYGREFTL